ncbi:hypothetical protein PoB_007474600 [Plakobranchus ocellatus]|uniref:Uncharacterized protein n=1 Tax=Plakobranchus ocellatus TaxID=259542 RepID=A0AAV4DWN5_9GAST|nr:hypothetical protein PoB_007474600 [Plakobranchus ocellatus]
MLPTSCYAILRESCMYLSDPVSSWTDVRTCFGQAKMKTKGLSRALTTFCFVSSFFVCPPKLDQSFRRLTVLTNGHFLVLTRESSSGHSLWPPVQVPLIKNTNWTWVRQLMTNGFGSQGLTIGHRQTCYTIQGERKNAL